MIVGVVGIAIGFTLALLTARAFTIITTIPAVEVALRAQSTCEQKLIHYAKIEQTAKDLQRGVFEEGN